MTESLRFNVSQVINLPTLPETAQKVLTLTNDPLLSMGKMVEIIELDPAISSKVLSVANSTFFGSSLNVENLSDAVMRIGFDQVHSIAVGISVLSFLGNPRKSYEYKMLFDHSIAVGLVAEEIAKSVGYRAAEGMMMNGLLHDLGLLVLNKFFPDIFQAIMDFNGNAGALLESEEKIIHYKHGDVGFWLAEQWNLPDSILDIILLHHIPSVA